MDATTISSSVLVGVVVFSSSLCFAEENVPLACDAGLASGSLASDCTSPVVSMLRDDCVAFSKPDLRLRDELVRRGTTCSDSSGLEDDDTCRSSSSVSDAWCDEGPFLRCIPASPSLRLGVGVAAGIAPEPSKTVVDTTGALTGVTPSDRTFVRFLMFTARGIWHISCLQLLKKPLENGEPKGNLSVSCEHHSSEMCAGGSKIESTNNK